jgi:hypothetical protein
MTVSPKIGMNANAGVKMGRTVPTVRQLMNEEYGEWIKMAKMLPPEERTALKELLDAALTRSDAGSIVPRVIPSETMFMLMLIHLKAKINELEERTED